MHLYKSNVCGLFLLDRPKEISVEAKDPYTRGHSKRTGHYSFGIAQESGLSEEQCKQIKTVRKFGAFRLSQDQRMRDSGEGVSAS